MQPDLFKDLLKRLRPLYGVTVDKLWIEYQVADVERKREIEEALLRVAVKNLGIGLGDERIVIEPPLANAVSDGDYKLGDVSYPGLDPYPCRVRRNDLLRHIFLLGPTGTGKSTFILGILRQFLSDRVPFMVFDFKRNYRCLLGAEHKNRGPPTLLVLTVGRNVAPLALNAMTPPSGVPFGEWAEALADVISTSYLLMQGARNVLSRGGGGRARGVCGVLTDWHRRVVRVRLAALSLEIPNPSGPRRTASETLLSLGSSRERGLSQAAAILRLEQDGANDVPEARGHPILRLAKKFWGLSAWMLEAIVVLSFILHKRADLGVAISLLVVNATLSFLQEERASTAITALRHRLNVSARVLRDGSWQTAPARSLVTGDVVRVRSGDFVPADLQLLDGTVGIDQSALTGESRELDRITDEILFSGSTVRQGEATGVVVATGVRTYFGRTAQLVQSAHPKLHVEEVISRVVRWLLVIVSVLVAATVIASLIEGLRLLDILPISLVLLMSAVPVALPVMFTVSMAVGSMELARQGVLVTRLSAVEDAANMDVLCADKTGTLTMNQVSFTGALPQPGFTENDVVQAGALASNEANADPIDLSFLRAAKDRNLFDAAAKTVSFQPFAAATRRAEAVIELGDRTIRVVKGALRTVAGAAGLDTLAVAALEERAGKEARKGIRVLAVARAEDEGPLRLVGLALLFDPPRPDSRRLIDELRALGIKVKMLTGDGLPVAQEIARELGMGEIIRAPMLRAMQEKAAARAADLAGGADGFAEVFPEDKFLVVKSLQAAGHVVAMTGDGVNDAPALRQAEVGIAVSGATDVAKGAASVVLTTEGLASIVDLVKEGRAIYQRVLTWIVNKVSRTILKAGFVVIAFLATGRFVISALGMVLLVFMTDFVKITLATDRVPPSPKPETWNIGPLVKVAIALGLLMLGESLGLFAFVWDRFGLASGDGRLQTFTFQVLLFFALFSIVSVRERRTFWSSRPSTPLVVGLAADAAIGVFVGIHGLAELQPIPFPETAAIIGYAAFCALGPNDIFKSILTARAFETHPGHSS